MHIANVTVQNKWEDLEELITASKGEPFTFDNSKNYYLVNCGGFDCLFLNQDSKPEEEIVSGLPVTPKEQCGLKLSSGKVYARCINGATGIHVEVEG